LTEFFTRHAPGGACLDTKAAIQDPKDGFLKNNLPLIFSRRFREERDTLQGPIMTGLSPRRHFIERIEPGAKGKEKSKTGAL
jgi:hypothetical protein